MNHSRQHFHVMFDIDGTILESFEFDEILFLEAVEEVTSLEISKDWSTYPHVTDRGILQSVIQRYSLKTSLEEFEADVKPIFVHKVNQHLKHHSVKEIPGAKKFLVELLNHECFRISIATGGWLESALLKLKSANINIDAIPIASADDHFSRIHIMRTAIHKSSQTLKYIPRIEEFTYFGDGSWDKMAAEELGMNLIIVGDKVKHSQTIMNFNDIDNILTYITGNTDQIG